MHYSRIFRNRIINIHGRVLRIVNQDKYSSFRDLLQKCKDVLIDIKNMTNACYRNLSLPNNN